MSYKFNPFTGKLDITGGGGITFTSDTKANILATTPTAGTYAISTDTDELFFYDGTSWQKSPFKVFVENANPDMGYIDGSNRLGYGDDYITDKTLSNTKIAGNVRDENGAVKVNTSISPNRLQIYLREKWNTIFEDLTTEYGDFRHTPIDREVYIWRGDSVAIGLNGRSYTQDYVTSMGAYPPARIIDGGAL